MDGGHLGGPVGERLRGLVERIERLEEEKQAIADDIREVKAEAKGNGFNIKVINRILQLRKMDPEERRLFEGEVELYKHALGMAPFDDTPLGATNPKPRPESTEPEKKGSKSDPAKAPAAKTPPAKPPARSAPAPDYPEDATDQEARDMGAKAFHDGKPVTACPFPPKDPRRAAWDEAWCRESGSDGMAIPKALQRKTPKSPAKSAPAKKTPVQKAAAKKPRPNEQNAKGGPKP